MPAYRFEEFMVPAGDGTKLLTRVLYPIYAKPGEKLPVVIHRTPYEENVDLHPFDSTTLGRPFTDFLDRGYVIVNQHCRGTGSSEGSFHNMQNERADGLSLLEWIRTQSFYNGEIYIYGNSYKGFTGMVLLGLNPPDVKGAVIAVMAANQSFCGHERNTCKHDLFTFWFAKTFRKNELDTNAIYAKMRKELLNRPLIDLSKRVYGEAVPELDKGFVADVKSSYWADSDEGIGESYDAPLKSDIPTLIVGGLYDIHFRGCLEYWRTLREGYKNKCAAFFGPWTHALATLAEHKAFFPGSTHPPIEAEWFDNIRTGAQMHYVTKGKLTYYRAGDGWIRTDDLGGVVYDDNVRHIDGEGCGLTPGTTPAGRTPLYLDCESSLRREPCPPAPLSYTYDPRDPLALPGGASVFQTPARGPQPQPAPGFRQDLLSFISDPLPSKLLLDGSTGVSLCVSSDCPDTAFFVRLDLVRGDTAWCLRDTIVSISDFYPDYVPGEKITLRFDLDPIAWRLEKGDAIRVDVSSSDFPCYNAHSNTREPWYEAKEVKIAHNTVYTGESFVLLPAAK